jgi:hypothetical protein
MCETSPEASDFKDAEKYELQADEPLQSQIPISDYNYNMYKFKKSNVKKFGEFVASKK